MHPQYIFSPAQLRNWKERTKYFDEVTHAELPVELVEAARADDVEYFNTLPVWDIVKTQD